MTNANLQARKNKVFARGQGNAYPVYVDHAKNSEIWDVEGKRYIDFGRMKLVPLDCDTIQTARDLGTCLGD